jgi:hypothetical protein
MPNVPAANSLTGKVKALAAYQVNRPEFAGGSFS